MYRLIGAGAAYNHLDPAQIYQIEAHLGNPTGFFAANPACTLNAQTGAAMTWKLTCTGLDAPYADPVDPNRRPFVISGELVGTACTAPASAAVQSQPLDALGSPVPLAGQMGQ